MTYLTQYTQPPSTGGQPTTFKITGPADTSLTASTEAMGINLDQSATKTFATGALTIQREIVLESPTYAFVGPSTITAAMSCNIDGLPKIGANSTITNAWALLVGNMGTQELTSVTGNNFMISIFMPGIANGIGTVTSIGGIVIDSDTGTIPLGNQTATLTSLSLIDIAALEFTSTTNVRTVTTPSAIYIEDAPIAGANVTFTEGPYSIFVDAGASRFDGRVLTTQGADVASASTVSLGAGGNVFELTGTTAVNLISSTGWQNGSKVTLIANENVTINHATATSGTNITILLSGAANFAMTANDTLTLVLSETTAGGQAWREISRTAI